MNILLIGKYYPQTTVQAKINELIAIDLAEQGHKVFLLSNAWCKVASNNFCGDVKHLSSNYPFTKRYFVDPQQMKILNKGMFCSYLGLACKIIEYESINAVVFLDNLEFIPILELLKIRYENLKCFYAMFNEDIVYSALDDYIHPFIQRSLNECDLIFADAQYSDFLCKYINIERQKVIIANPFQYKCIQNTSIPQLNELYIFCEDTSYDHCSKVITRAKCTINNNIEVKLASFNKEFSYASLEFLNKQAKIGTGIKEKAFILHESELFYKSRVPYIPFVQTALKLNFVPTTLSRNIPVSGLENVNYCLQDDLCIISECHGIEHTISELITENF